MLYTLGRLCALINPAIFPDWTFVAAPLFFLLLQYLIAPVWTTQRIAAPKRERLSKRFWLLGPRLAAMCFALDMLITLFVGQPVTTLGGSPLGPALPRLLNTGPHHLTLSDYALYEVKSAAALFALFTLAVICTKLAQGGFLRFTMPAGGNRVTL
ncbi:MAG: hypothetical protein E6J34_10165 [Chloroflexi bacterium]|nr:MAG: hypothetical protein E6J34_10165 [Chloroflexota bacterium]